MRTYDMRGFKLRFADFECVLLRLGFERQPTAETQMFYQHTNSDTWILLPAYTSDALVRPVHFVAARRLIDDHGLLDERDFDRMIADAASESEANCEPEEPKPLAIAP